MAWNISCEIRMNPSCTKEIKFIKLKKDPINDTSNKDIHKSLKIRNTPNSFTRIVMQTMKWIYQIDAQSPPQLISSMVPSLTGASGSNQKLLEAVQMHKQ